jgi:uncharacterized membrane protein/protein-disulfide isomerase
VKTQHTAWPYPFYFWQVAVYALVGWLTSLYLIYTHYKNHTDLAFSSFCAVTQAINCDTVAQSPWSIFWGLPLALWGLFVYSLFLVLLIPLRKFDEKRVSRWSFITILALLASGFSVYLAVLSATRIHSWCVLCVLTYAVNFLLAFATWITFCRFSTVRFFPALPAAFNGLAHTAPVRWGVAFLIALLIAGRFFIPTYWLQDVSPISAKVATGITKEGHPWIGAETPQFVIEEFTDYQCFQCSKVHFYLRQLINQHPDRIRLVHRHYPLDHEFNRIIAPDPFHVGSGRLALVAVVAANHGSFWAVNDALYQAAQSKKDSIEIDAFAQLMQISTEQLATEMFTEKTLKYLQHDMVQGLQHGITGTPSFVVDGKVYQKSLPPELLGEMLK